MKILIYGAGAIGGYIGSAFARARHEVAFIARPAQADLLNERGLTLHGLGAAVGPLKARAFTSPAEALAHDAYDGLVLALKSFDTQTAIADLKATGGPSPTIVSVQNGVDNEPQLRAAFGVRHIIAGTVLTAVANPEPGIIVVEKSRGVGLEAGHPLSERLASALRAGGIPSRLYSSAEAMKWSKLMTNIMANATAAICDLSSEAVYAHPGLYEIEIRMLREALNVMDAKRLSVVDLPRVPTVALSLALRWLPSKLYQPILVRMVTRGRGTKKPSFHQDLSAGKPRTEVNFLNGAVARHAEALGLAAPVNCALTDILEGIVAGRMAWSEYQGQPDVLVREILK